jgi:hypothetical protein
MNPSPYRDQPLALASRLLHHATQITATHANDPIQRYTSWSCQDDLRLATLSENMHVGRTVIVGENYEPKAMGAVNGNH